MNSYEHPSELLHLRQAMKEHNSFIPQYWFGDYTGYMEELAYSTHLNLTRNDNPFTSSREGPVSPSRYLSPTDDFQQAAATMRDLHKTYTACTQNGLYIPRAVFRALQGKWRIHRTISSKLSTYPSGVLEGTASFHPRTPTSPDFDLEYLYIESGILTLSSNPTVTMTASRRYVYRYSEERDELSVWFVKPAQKRGEEELEVDYLFHNLIFESPPSNEKGRKDEGGGLVAKADHLCVKDMYTTAYNFPLKGIALHNFGMRHEVKGPEKDYVARTGYSRP